MAAALLAAALGLPAAPADAGYQPVPYDPLPTSYAQLPLGPPTAVPWWQRGKLHIGATTIRTRLPDLAARAGTTVVGSGWEPAARRSTLSLVRGSVLEHLPVRGHIRGPEISADGHWVAWLDEQAQPLTDRFDRVHYRLVLYDATTSRIVAEHRETRRVEREDGGNSLVLVSVANTGQVVFGRGNGGPHVLAPGRRVVRLKGDVHQLRELDGWPLGMTDYKRGGERGVYGTISRRGRFHAVGVTSYFSGSWSPGGDGFAFELQGASQNTYWVDRLALGTTVQLGLPSDRDQLYVVGWEGPGSVLLWDDDPFAEPAVSQLVRCDVASGDCQRVDGGPVPGRPAHVAF